MYVRAKITDWEHPELTELESDILALNKPLAEKSLDAFELAMEKSLQVKNKKSEVETLPVSDNEVAKQALYTYLEQYNKDLNACCLETIHFINRFLYSEKEKYYSVIKLGHNTGFYMGKLIRGEIKEAELREMLDSERDLVANLPASHAVAQNH